MRNPSVHHRADRHLRERKAVKASLHWREVSGSKAAKAHHGQRAPSITLVNVLAGRRAGDNSEFFGPKCDEAMTKP